jgi:hypothetical protein
MSGHQKRHQRDARQMICCRDTDDSSVREANPSCIFLDEANSDTKKGRYQIKKRILDRDVHLKITTVVIFQLDDGATFKILYGRSSKILYDLDSVAEPS